MIDKLFKVKRLLLGVSLSLVALTLWSCQRGRKTYDDIGEFGLTTRTENLQRNLLPFEDKGVMLGQMYATAEGIGWMGDTVKSDIHEITGNWPACTGYELCGIESGKKCNADGIDTLLIRKTAVDFMRHQGLVVMTWTAPCPEKAGNIATVLESGSKANEQLKSWTINIASFLSSLHDEYGIKLPVLLYLYPLGNGCWYDKLNAEDYKKLYAQTVEWLRSDCELTNAIFGYSNDYRCKSVDEFMSRCPENDIDCIQMTCYPSEYDNYGKELLAKVHELSVRCSSMVKAFGVSTGVRGLGDDANFWSKNIVPVVKSCRISYMMLGKNHGDFKDGNFCAPYAGNNSVSDFVEFCNTRQIIMAKNLNGLWLKKEDKEK